MIKGSTVLGEQGLKILSLSSFPGVFAAFHGVPFCEMLVTEIYSENSANNCQFTARMK